MPERRPRQGEVYWVNLDPTVGREIQKQRPGLIVSPDEMNRHLETVIVAPLTSTVRPFATRVSVVLAGRESSLCLDQIRAVSTLRLGRKIATIDPSPALQILREMFA